jgi:hypothetical protein
MHINREQEAIRVFVTGHLGQIKDRGNKVKNVPLVDFTSQMLAIVTT